MSSANMGLKDGAIAGNGGTVVPVGTMTSTEMPNSTGSVTSEATGIATAGNNDGCASYPTATNVANGPVDGAVDSNSSPATEQNAGKEENASFVDKAKTPITPGLTAQFSKLLSDKERQVGDTATIKVEDTSDPAYQSEPNDTSLTLFDARLWGLEERKVRDTVGGFLSMRPDPGFVSLEPKFLIGRYVVKLMKQEEFSQQRCQAVYDILKCLYQIGDLTTTKAETTGIHGILRGCMGESPSKRPFKFPEPFPAMAALIYERIQENSGFEETVNEDHDSSPPPIAATAGQKRKRDKKTSSPTVERKELDLDDPQVRRYMYNIKRGEGSRKSYMLADRKLKTSSKPFGHNGLRIGQWWPFYINALQAGAHGSSQGGIAGDQRDGARSVVVSGGYDELDTDQGQVIRYSGSNSHDNTAKEEAQISNATKAMQRSLEVGNRIRVLRTAGGNPEYAPAVGLRYDGLYRILRQEEATNKKGGLYVRFVLKREPDQPDIVTSRPTDAEKKAFYTLKNSV